MNDDLPESQSRQPSNAAVAGPVQADESDGRYPLKDVIQSGWRGRRPAVMYGVCRVDERAKQTYTGQPSPLHAVILAYSARRGGTLNAQSAP